MITDQFGNRGLDRHGPSGPGSDPDNILQPDEIDIRSTAQVGGFGSVNAQAPPQNIRQRPMYNELELQHSCNTTNLDECNYNANCQMNSQLYISDDDSAAIFLRGLKKDAGPNAPNEIYWRNKWPNEDDDSDVCGWTGITCDTIDDRNTGKEQTYVSKIDIPARYLKDNSSDSTKTCINSGNYTSVQNEWVNKQSSRCQGLTIDEQCSDNMFCQWTTAPNACYDSNNNTIRLTNSRYNNPDPTINEANCKQDGNTWGPGEKPIATDGCYDDNNNRYPSYNNSDPEVNKNDCENDGYNWELGGYKYKPITNTTSENGTCSLDRQYRKLSGLNPNDDFSSKTMDQILGDLNNGRVADINIFDNVTKDTRKDVIMNQNNAEIAVKGIVEETALSKYFFSNENVNALQQTIRYRVYQKTNEVVDYQSSNELFIIMRSVLLQHGNFKVSSSDILNEILKLNKRVEVYAVNEVASNVVQYKGYLKDVEKLPVPMDRPRYDDNGSRNRTYDLSNHISPMASEGWQSRHRQELLTN